MQFKNTQFASLVE